MLEARGLSKRYGALHALRDLSFAVRPGEALGLLGPNGSGKSTTVNILVGLLDPTSGDVFFRGRPIREAPLAYRKSLGYVPETPNLYPYLSGREYLDLVGCLREIPSAECARRIRRLLELFGLGSDGGARIASYSKGMRQKILISAALLDNPLVLVFDEPLSGLDVTSALVFRDLVKALAAAGKTIVYCSHALETVERICDRVVVLRRGVVAAHDSVENLRALMNSPSLEDVFRQLAIVEDTAQVASRIVETIMEDA